MKFYNTPEIETLKFAVADDVICTSKANVDNGGVGTGDGTNPDHDDEF